MKERKRFLTYVMILGRSPRALYNEFFGCAGVAKIENLQQVLLHVGREGHRHHVSVAPGRVAEPVHEALAHYLGFAVARPQRGDGA